jgi:phosphoserine phosphatase
VTRAGSVVFDCDSTLSAIEGIEWVSAGNPEVERLTRAAMDGEVPLEAVYARRLERVRPDRATVSRLGRAYIDALVPDTREVVAALLAEGIAVRVISGGLLPAVRVLAQDLGITGDDVAAVDVFFDAAGAYSGFDTASPLARAGGKREVLEAWGRALRRPSLLVGDGMTDLEARSAVDVFVAFAGVAVRDPVVAAADHVIRACSLAPVLPLALAGRPPRTKAAVAVFERGFALLEPADRVRLQHQPERELQRD